MRTLITLSLILVMGASLFAQDFPDLDKSPMDMAYFPPRAAFRAFAKTEEEKKGPLIRVIYSRPQKKGRDIFGGTVKFGELWRIGANESTEVMFYKDATVNGTKLKSGRYTLVAIPSEDSWEIHFTTDLDGWGRYAFDPEKHTVAKVSVPTEKTSGTVEALGIFFKKVEGGAHMVIGWGDTMVAVPIMM